MRYIGKWAWTSRVFTNVAMVVKLSMLTYIIYSWISDISNLLQKNGFGIIKSDYIRFEFHLVQECT